MVSQEELEYAIARYKARQAGQEFEDVVPTAQGSVVADADELGADAYQVDESMSEGVEAYQDADADFVEPEAEVEGVPHHVQSLSDSSLIELGDEGYDPDRDR